MSSYCCSVSMCFCLVCNKLLTHLQLQIRFHERTNIWTPISKPSTRTSCHVGPMCDQVVLSVRHHSRLDCSNLTIPVIAVVSGVGSPSLSMAAFITRMGRQVRAGWFTAARVGANDVLLYVGQLLAAVLQYICIIDR